MIRLLEPMSLWTAEGKQQLTPGLISGKMEALIRDEHQRRPINFLEVPDEPPCHDDNLPRASLPVEGAARKEIPLARGLLDYFPAALAAVAALSKKGNDQHNPGEPMHHARGKSMDHADCVVRHLVDRGTVDSDGVRHSAKVAWRALALLQEELEREEGAAFPRGAKK